MIFCEIAVILSLKKAGSIVNIKGKSSRYGLDRNASEINVLQIHAAFEEEIAVVKYTSEFNEGEL